MTPEARLERFNEAVRNMNEFATTMKEATMQHPSRTNKQVYVTPREWIELSQLALDLGLTHNGKGSVSKLMQAIANKAITCAQ
jgi:hypothetical protein